MTKKEAQVYIVATPIGNKGDFSKRAVDTLKNVDIIACEDSRTSANLLESFGINTKLISYHKFNEKQRTEEFLRLIEEGKKIALISDAGTPCISDPGRVLINELYEQGINITSIPGACAVVAFLSMIPRESEEFAFAGFLPRVKGQQIKTFEKFLNTDMVFYESPNRLLDTLSNIEESRGVDAKVAVGRELTKMFEEVKTGTVSEIKKYFENNILKGEIVCMLYASHEKEQDESQLIEKIKKLKKMNYTDKDISQILSNLYDENKNKIYKLSLSIKNNM